MSINFFGFINTTGYGVVGKNICKELFNLDSSTALFPLGGIEFDEPWIHECIKNAEYFDKHAPSFRLNHQFSMAESIGKGKRLGYTFFELDKLTSLEKHHLASLDELLLPCEWARQVCLNAGLTNVSKESVRCGVDTSIFNPSVQKAKIGVDEDTTIFLNVGKWEIRKGHDILLQMFERAFDETEKVLLIMCCHNFLKFPGFDGEKESEKWYNYYMNSKLGRAGKILVIKDRLPTQNHLAQLMQAADFGIFPSRAEGWNLDAAEMLAMGKNVILTDYSAHTEFADKAGCFKIPYRTSEEALDKPFFNRQGNWMEIGQKEIDIGVQLMRHLVYKEGTKINQKGIDLFSSEITWAKSASQILNAGNS